MRLEHEQELATIRERIRAATASGDLASMIGHAKDLMEAASKIVLVERSVSFGDQTKAPEIMTKALKALDLPPRLADSGDDELNRIVDGLWRAGKAVFDLRNRVGTGHGRPSTPGITSDLALLAVRASEAWVEWAMERLDRLHAGDVDVLISDLLEPAVFRGGELARRFSEVRLHALDEIDQQRLGVAVAQRCRGETFTVRIDGLDAVIANLEQWPRAYRAGLVEGLLLDRQGHLHPAFIAELVVLVSSLDRDEWSGIVDDARHAPWSVPLASDVDGLALDLGEQMAQKEHVLAPFFRSGWSEIAAPLRSQSPF